MGCLSCLGNLGLVAVWGCFWCLGSLAAWGRCLSCLGLLLLFRLSAVSVCV